MGAKLEAWLLLRRARGPNQSICEPQNPHIWALELCPLWFKMEVWTASTAQGGVSTAQGNPWNVLDEHMSA